MSVGNGTLRLIGVLPTSVEGNHGNPVSDHNQGIRTLIEISGKRVSWLLPKLYLGEGGAGSKSDQVT